MYQRLSSVLFPVMTLLLIGAAYWGYQEHQEKNSILIKAENQYQKAFHDLSYHMDRLHHQLGTTLAVNAGSQNFQRKSLVNVWRLTSQAQSEINQLPVRMLPFQKTGDFLSHISNFAYKASMRDLTKQPLTDGEMKTMQTLFDKSSEINRDLEQVQNKVLQDKLRWMDVETALAADRQQSGNAIVEGFKTVDSKVGQFDSIDWGPTVTSLYEKRTVSMLSGKPATPEEIKRKAAEFLGLGPDAPIKVTENGKGTPYASYSAIVEKGSGKDIAMDFTYRGGDLLWFVKPRDIADKKLKLAEAKSGAAKFLDKHGYKDMEAVTYDEFGNEGVFTYVAKQDGVLLYPDKLTVKVALDDGEVVGLQAGDYVYAHKKRDLAKPALAETEARKGLTEAMGGKAGRLALIKNEDNEEVLCYEYKGKSNGFTYRVYINAETGAEEAVEEIPEA
ncbi:germination protein YpeB [Paenibacillus pasadenensis]|uniref:Spore germination protein YpeB n=1 Tax=Paenibacillus pasadenensis TaxID=217090 RepID=A0A2N5N5N9_9BACL|nr:MULTISPECIES: germination protein YpeB [Paenibacillus]PLT45623.1 Spore germination protein YpeB [Paenibacillus pasadenensis]QGG56072.1 germination protein YpeB [Paenibacillus sp. B01]